MGQKSRLFAHLNCLWSFGLPNSRRKSGKVSGLIREYTRFAKTIGEGDFDQD